MPNNLDSAPFARLEITKYEYHLICGACGENLKKRGELVHHETVTGLIFKKPSTCPHAGKNFKNPFYRIELEEM